MEVKTHRTAQIYSNLSKEDLTQATAALATLGPEAHQVLELMKGLAAAIEQLGGATAELKLAIEVHDGRARVSGQVTFGHPEISPHPPQEGSTQLVDMERDIYTLSLSHRARKVCRRLQALTVGELMKYSAENLSEHKNCGRITIQEIREALASVGAKLKDD